MKKNPLTHTHTHACIYKHIHTHTHAYASTHRHAYTPSVCTRAASSFASSLLFFRLNNPSGFRLLWAPLSNCVLSVVAAPPPAAPSRSLLHSPMPWSKRGAAPGPAGCPAAAWDTRSRFLTPRFTDSWQLALRFQPHRGPSKAWTATAVTRAWHP